MSLIFDSFGPQVQPPELVLEEGAPESPPQSPTPPVPTAASSAAGGGQHRPTHSRNASNCSIETIKSVRSLTQEEIERSTTLPSMISNCIETFQQLFLKFVELKVLVNPQEVAKYVRLFSAKRGNHIVVVVSVVCSRN